jgi:glycosyltransferase involved in cell wall biosynthesis
VAADELVITLETPLPAALPAGTVTPVFLAGTCFHRRAAVRSVEVVVDGVRHRVTAARMPRRDAGRSGFWATVPIVARPPRAELGIAARLQGGGEAVASLGEVPVTPQESPPHLGAEAPAGLIAICMATFEPDPELFRAQVESLRAQTDPTWTCVISDDGSAPEHVERIRAAIACDDRFRLVTHADRAGVLRNFERALRLAPAEAGLIALSDQDDVWHPGKLAALRAAIGTATLVYSDQRLVDATGRVLRDTLWRGRRNNHTDIVSLLIANSITGAASLFRREVAELALPFPDTPGLTFHDHWIGLVALAAGEVAYVDRPLYDYVQHSGAVFGEVTHAATPRLRPVLEQLRGAYFRGYLSRAVLAEALLLRCGGRLTAGKRRALQRVLAAERDPLAWLWLALRPLRALAGRNETLGSEAALAAGIAWRRAAGLLGAGDASLPGLLSYQQTRLRRWRARV